jgi:putative aldouronate transport system substrate-binding protein
MKKESIMKKKLISAVLCTALVVSTLAGCGSKKTENTGSKDGNYDKFITVDVYDDFANYQGIQSGWFAKVVKDKFNMELNIIAPNVAGGGDTLYQTRSAAGDLGDLVLINTNNGRLNDVVSAGLVMDATDLMDGKDILKNYGDAVTATNTGLSEDGMYAFPNSVSSDAATEASEGLEPTFGPYIRWDYYKQLGYPEMNNLEDFLDVLEQMQTLARQTEGSNDIYAISLFKDWDDNMLNNAKQIACMYGYDEVGFELLSADGSSTQSIIDDDSVYIQALKFFYEANQRGLVDPDSTTQNYDTWSAKYTNGKVLYCPWPWVGQNLYNTAENKAAGKGFMFAPVKDMKIFSYGSCPEGDSSRVICIGSNAEDPQRMADFIDWLYSPEGIRLNGQSNGAAGIEGLTYEVNSDGKPELTDFGKKALPNNSVEVPEEYGGGNWKDGVSALNFKPVNLEDIDPDIGEAYDWQTWETTIANNQTELDKDWAEHMGASSTMEYVQNNNMLEVAPGSSYSIPEADSNITTVRGQCKSAVVDNSWKMVFASNDSEFASILKDMQTTAKGLGYDDVLEVDKQNAKDWTAARKASAEKYPEGKNTTENSSNDQ